MRVHFPNIEYQNADNLSFRDQLLEQLAKTDGTIIRNFPVDKNALLEFGHVIGKPMPKAAFNAHNVETQGGMGFIGDIRYKPAINANERMPTQDFRRINFHTARAYAETKPKYFCMLMFNAGWTGFEHGKNGESRLLTVDDFLDEFNRVSGTRTDEYLTALHNEGLSYKPTFYSGDVGAGSLLWTDEGKDCFRFWEGITNNLPETLALVEPGSVMESALTAVSKTLSDARESFITSLRPGDLILIDNRRVAHARHGFLSERPTSEGGIEYSQRQVLNLQIA